MTGDIVGVFDIDNCTQGRDSRDFLNAAERAGRVVTVGEDLPRSFIVAAGKSLDAVYISQISPGTIKKRLQSGAKAIDGSAAAGLEG